jgi:hypothetical protein
VSGSVSDQWGAVCVGDLCERCAARGPSFRVPHTNSLTLTPSRAATREPACWAAQNFPKGRSYFLPLFNWSSQDVIFFSRLSSSARAATSGLGSPWKEATMASG